MEGGESLLVIKPSSLGDIVHTLPAVAALHRANPETSVRWIVNTEWAPLLGGLDFVEPVPFPRRRFGGPRGWSEAVRWARGELAPLRPGRAIDFQGLLRSAWLARMARPHHLAGFRRARELAWLAYDERVVVDGWDARHAVDRNLALAEACGAERPVTPEFLLPEGEPVPAAWLPGGPPAVVLHPFSRGTGKSLSRGEVAAFCEMLSPLPVAIVGGSLDWGDTRLPPNAADLLGRTSLVQLIRLIRDARWTVSVDSGPMHLAAGVTGNLVSIHTWSDPRMVGPGRPDAWVMREGTLLRAGEIEPGRFPEQRHRRAEFAAAPFLVDRSGWERIAALVTGE